MVVDPRFARELRQARRGRRLTQQDLAVHLGCHASTVAKWEGAKGYPSFMEYLGLCDLFGWPNMMLELEPQAILWDGAGIEVEVRQTEESDEYAPDHSHVA